MYVCVRNNVIKNVATCILLRCTHRMIKVNVQTCDAADGATNRAVGVMKEVGGGRGEEKEDWMMVRQLGLWNGEA